MPTTSITWTSKKELPCGSSTPYEIILVVPSDKLAQRNCPIQPLTPPELTEQTSFAYDTLDAVLVNSYENYDACGNKSWTYTAEIDSDQLVAGQEILISDILGVACKGPWAKWVNDQVGNEIKVEKVGAAINIISQHGCIYSLDALDANGLASGIWGSGGLNLPACDINGGQLIYVNDNGELMAEPARPIVTPTRPDAGSYDSGLGNVPAHDEVGLTPAIVTYLNNLCRPVLFLPFLEFPTVVLDAGAANVWSVAVDIVGSNPSQPGWGAAQVPTVVRFAFPTAGGGITFPPGMTGYPGPTVVNPGDTLTLSANWRFLRGTFNANGANQVRIFGPRINFVAHAL